MLMDVVINRCCNYANVRGFSHSWNYPWLSPTQFLSKVLLNRLLIFMGPPWWRRVIFLLTQFLNTYQPSPKLSKEYGLVSNISRALLHSKCPRSLIEATKFSRQIDQLMHLITFYMYSPGSPTICFISYFIIYRHRQLKTSEVQVARAGPTEVCLMSGFLYRFTWQIQDWCSAHDSFGISWWAMVKKKLQMKHKWV